MTSQRQNQRDRRVVEGSSRPDYSAVKIPAKPATEYTVDERRSELLQLIEQAGHPKALNQTELADRYGVSQQQISKDIDALADYVNEHLGSRHVLTIDSVLQRSIQGLLEEGEYRQAARTAIEYDEWVAERTDLDDIRDELELLRRATGMDHTE